MITTLNACDGDAEAMVLQQPAADPAPPNKKTREELFSSLGIIIPERTAKESKSRRVWGTIELEWRGRQEIMNMYGSLQRRRPPTHSKRRASRHSRPTKSQAMQMTTTCNASDGDAEMEAEAAMIVKKQPPTWMVVKPMASTAFSSDSDDD